MGQTNVHRYMKPLMDRIEKGEINPSFVITDRYGLDCGPEAYKTFDKHEHGCIKVVLQPA
jgi:threonine dehydrogenase-like Zn-dependent dehydrogenase